MQDKKEEMLDDLQAEFDRWVALLAGLDDEQITARQLPADLSIKDVIAHLWAWQQISIARLEAASQGRDPVFPWPENFDPEADDVEPANAWIHQANLEKPWQQVYADWKAGYQHLLELARAIPPADLMQQGKYPWLDGYSLYDVLDGTYDHHHREHLAPLLAWLREKS